MGDAGLATALVGERSVEFSEGGFRWKESTPAAVNAAP
jgi:hypothetical protein